MIYLIKKNGEANMVMGDVADVMAAADDGKIQMTLSVLALLQFRQLHGHAATVEMLRQQNAAQEK